MNILFLVHRIPYPPDKGDKIRAYHMIRHLSRVHAVHLGTLLESEKDRHFLEGLKGMCADICAEVVKPMKNLLHPDLWAHPLSVIYFYNDALQRYVDRKLSEGGVDAVICYCSSMAEYVFRSDGFRQKREKKIRLIMDFVDLDSDKWKQYAVRGRFPKNLVYRYEHVQLGRYEKKINALFDQCLFVSRNEADAFARQCRSARNVRVVPNGVDQAFFVPAPAGRAENPEQRPCIVFTGMMDYFANVDAVTWFCRAVFPMVKEECPQAAFYIVGNKPSAEVLKLHNGRDVFVTGFVADIRDYYWRADVCVAPLRIARGLQNKVIEAMATGNAVAATSRAGAGVVCKHGENILIADDPRKFADHVVNILRDQALRERLGRAALENVREHYSWERNLQDLDRLLHR